MEPTETINPKFLKALIDCYMLQKQVRKRVFHNKRFYKQVVKVFKWKQQIKEQIRDEQTSESGSTPSQPSTSYSSFSPSSSSINHDHFDPNPNAPNGMVPSLKQESQDDTATVANVDIVRRNLWLMIARNEIIHAHKRKMHLHEQKLIKNRAVAQRCLAHIKEFRRQNQCKSSPNKRIQR